MARSSARRPRRTVVRASDQRYRMANTRGQVPGGKTFSLTPTAVILWLLFIVAVAIAWGAALVWLVVTLFTEVSTAWGIFGIFVALFAWKGAVKFEVKR